MATDPRQLRPSMLTRMLNSTPLGEVTSERQLRRIRRRRARVSRRRVRPRRGRSVYPDGCRKLRVFGRQTLSKPRAGPAKASGLEGPGS